MTLRALLNQGLFFWSRRTPRYRRRPYSESTGEGPAQDLLPSDYLRGLSVDHARVALGYAWLLRELPWRGPAQTLTAVDIGSKNFVYAAALAHFLHTRNDPQTLLLGLEADPYRLYWNLYRRGDYGRYFASQVPNTPAYYLEGNWLEWRPAATFDLIFCLFPLLYPDLSDRSGLPRQYFQPEALYRKAMQQSANIIFMHQGEAETEDSLRLLNAIGLGTVVFARSYIKNPWFAQRHPIHVLLWQR